MADLYEMFQASVTDQPEQQTDDIGGDFTAAIHQEPAYGPQTSARYAGQAAMINGDAADGAAVALTAEVPDTKAERQAAVGQFYQSRQLALQQYVQQNMTSSPDVLEATLAQAQQTQANIVNDSNGAVAAEVAYVESAAPQGADDARRREAFRVAVANDLAELSEAQGFMENTADILSLFVPFGMAKDITDITAQIKERPELGELEGSDLDAVVMAWKTLPVARQEQLYPALRDAIIDATKTSVLGAETDGNITKATQLLMQFMSFEGAAALKDERNLDVAYGLADTVPVGYIADLARATKAQKVAASAVLKNATVQAVQETNAVRVAAKAGDAKAAAAHNLSALADENVAKGMGTTQLDASLTAMPLETGQWYKAVVDDNAVTAAFAKDMEDTLSTAAGYSRSLTTESNLLQVGALTESERKQAITGFFQRMEKTREDWLASNMSMDNLRIVDEAADGFTYEYVLRDASTATETAVVRQGTVKFGINDVTGTYQATVQDKLAQQASNIVSPTTWAKYTADGDFGLEVKRAIQSSDLGAAYTARTAEMLQWAVDPVRGVAGKKARQRIEDVLLAGDEFINPETQLRGRVFTPAELAAGVETARGTVRLTSPSEVESYYRFRMYADTQYMAENYALRQELELGGFKTVRMFGSRFSNEVSQGVRNAATSVGKPFEDVGSALASVRNKIGQGVWDDKAGRVIDISEDYIRKAYEEGDQLVRLKSRWNTKGTGDLDASGEMVEYVRVARNRVSDLPTQVLNYKPGYVPKINKAQFVVKQQMPVIARGHTEQQFRSQAMRAFDSLDNANKFREEQIQKFMAKHQVDRQAAERVFPEPGRIEELTTAERLEEAVGSHGGLFHGTRSKDELLFGLDGQRLERFSPFESFQRQTAHIGTFLSRNAQRVGQERRWMNTVRQLMPDVQIKGFEGTAIPTNTPQGRALERIRTQIREWNGIPTREESMFQGAVQVLHDWAINRGLKEGSGIPRSLQWLKHSDPATAIKAAVMHNLLGALNPAQIYVQASAALVAATKYPSQAPAAVSRAATFWHLDNVRNGKTVAKVTKMLTNGKVATEADIAAYNAYRRTGLYEAVFNNVDMAKVSSDGLGIAADVMRKADNVSLMFYRSGELFNRRFSFAVEFENWAKKTGKTVPTDDELSKILEATNKNMLELNAANKAWWQGGRGTGAGRQLLGLATQFLQVTAKTMELALKSEGRGGFTKGQKARIIAGQVALFGAAGVPLASAVAPGIASWLGIDEMDENTALFANQGLVGLGVNAMLGSELDISNRAALGGGVTELLKDIATSTDPLWIKAFGPAASGVFGRAWDSIGELSVLFNSDRTGYRDLTSEDVKLAFSSLLNIPSSTRNLWKGWLMSNYHQIVDNRQQTLITKDFEFWTEIGTMIGFRPSAETTTRMVQLSNRDMEDMAKELADVRIRLLHRAIYQMHLDPGKTQRISDMFQIMDESVPAWVRERTATLIANRIYGDGGESVYDREVKGFIERTAAEKITDDALLDTGVGFGSTDQPFTRPFSQLLQGREEE